MTRRCIYLCVMGVFLVEKKAATAPMLVQRRHRSSAAFLSQIDQTISIYCELKKMASTLMAFRTECVVKNHHAAAIQTNCKLSMLLPHSTRFLSPQCLKSAPLRPSKRQKLAPLSASAEEDVLPLAAVVVKAEDRPFYSEQTTTDGLLIIAPLTEEEVGAASVCLTRAFATSPQGIPIEDGR